MTVEIAIGLAATVVTKFLAPLLKSGAQKLGEIISSDLGEEAAKKTVEVSEGLWDKVKSVFTSDDEKATLEKFDNEPDGYAGPMKDILADKLSEDPDLLSEVEELVNTPTGAGTVTEVIGNKNIVSTINAQGAKLSGGSKIIGVDTGSSTTSTSDD